MGFIISCFKRRLREDAIFEPRRARGLGRRVLNSPPLLSGNVYVVYLLDYWHRYRLWLLNVYVGLGQDIIISCPIQ